MKISCSKKLLEELKLTPIALSEEIPPIYSWSAHIIIINRRKTVVCINDLSRFGFVLYGLKAKDFKRFDTLIVEEMRRCLLDYCVKPEIIEKYLAASEGAQLMKSSSRKSVARLNKAAEFINFYADMIDDMSMPQQIINRRMNYDFISDADADHGYIIPNEKMFYELKSLFGDELFRCQAADFMIKLNLERYIAWRRVVVPLHYSFLQFHTIIQKAFGWGDRHQYQFDLVMPEDDNREIYITADIEDGYREIDGVYYLSNNKTLAEFILRCPDFIYTYDLGDEWEHEIHVNSIIEDYDNYRPACLMGEGEGPPEDVGGVYGYIQLLEAINDPDHVANNEIRDWYASQHHIGFDIRNIEGSMKYL